MDQMFLTVAVNPANPAGLRAALQRLIDMLPDSAAESRQQGLPLPLTGTFASLSWPPERLQQLRSWLRPTSKAWAALVRMAQEPEGCPRAALLTLLGIGIRDLPGTLSPIGKFLKKYQYAHLPALYQQDELLFKMDAEVAQKIRSIEEAATR